MEHEQGSPEITTIEDLKNYTGQQVTMNLFNFNNPGEEVTGILEPYPDGRFALCDSNYELIQYIDRESFPVQQPRLAA